jgi:hypothetical protein
MVLAKPRLASQEGQGPLPTLRNVECRLFPPEQQWHCGWGDTTLAAGVLSYAPPLNSRTAGTAGRRAQARPFCSKNTACTATLRRPFLFLPPPARLNLHSCGIQSEYRSAHPCSQSAVTPIEAAHMFSTVDGHCRAQCSFSSWMSCRNFSASTGSNCVPACRPISSWASWEVQARLYGRWLSRAS